MKTNEIKAGMVVEAKDHVFDICTDHERGRLFAWNRSNRQENDPIMNYASFVAAQERSWIDDVVSDGLVLVDTIAEVDHPACPPATTKALRQIEQASSLGGLEVHRALWKLCRELNNGPEDLVAAISQVGGMLSMFQIDPELCFVTSAYAIGVNPSKDFPLDRAQREASANVAAGFYLGSVIHDEALKDPQNN